MQKMHHVAVKKMCSLSVATHSGKICRGSGHQWVAVELCSHMYTQCTYMKAFPCMYMYVREIIHTHLHNLHVQYMNMYSTCTCTSWLTDACSNLFVIEKVRMQVAINLLFGLCAKQFPKQGNCTTRVYSCQYTYMVCTKDSKSPLCRTEWNGILKCLTIHVKIIPNRVLPISWR